MNARERPSWSHPSRLGCSIRGGLAWAGSEVLATGSSQTMGWSEAGAGKMPAEDG